MYKRRTGRGRPNFMNNKAVKNLRAKLKKAGAPPAAPNIKSLLDDLAQAMTPVKVTAVKRKWGWPQMRRAVVEAPPRAVPPVVVKSLNNKQLAQILVDAFVKGLRPLPVAKREAVARPPGEFVPQIVAEAAAAGVSPPQAVKFALPSINISRMLEGFGPRGGGSPPRAPGPAGPSFWQRFFKAFESGPAPLPRAAAPPRQRQRGPVILPGSVPIVGPSGAAPVTTTTTVTGPSITGPTVSVTSPNIKIQLNGLARATEAARNNTSKMNALMRTVENLKAKLPAGSETVKVIETLYRPSVPLPTPSNVRNKVNAAVIKETKKEQARQTQREVLKPKEPPKGRKYKDMSYSELLSVRRKASSQNRKEINRYLMEDVESALRKIDQGSYSERGWRLAELYKSLPESFDGRRRVLRAIQSEIRRTGRDRDPIEAARRLRDLVNNMGGRSRIPSELRRELRIQEERAARNYKRYERRYGLRETARRQYYPGMAVQGRLTQRPTRGSLVQRRTQGPPLRQGSGPAIPSAKGPAIFQGPKPLKQGTSLALPQMRPSGQPLLPEPQRAALNKAGGPSQALKVIASVPGGAPVVARAAADLNEMNGNQARAMALKGTPKEAMQAVVKLGGARNAGYTLEALNTLAQKRPTRAKKRGKKAPLRLAELNKVIEAVKRKKLVSLVAHNVAQVAPSNINKNSKKKKYYKKVLKSWILKRPLGNSVRQAARKNRS